MENKGLIFIPDISGFTRFVNETDIEHSRLIIQELLEIIINANQIGLEISEVEGDAILFYKFGDHADLAELYKQVKKMFCDFHRSLMAYDKSKFCQCTACISAANLSLKVITHYGEFTQYNVQNFKKLIGKDVIVAHQLLKNDIPRHEYWLVTKSLLQGNPNDFEQWMKWDSSAKQTDNGEIGFYYTQLSELKNEIPEEAPLQLEMASKAKMISMTKEFDTDIITLFHATGEFKYRSEWIDGIVRVEEVGHFLPRVGMRCRNIMENGEVITYASSYSFSYDHIEFSETDEKKQYSTYYTLEKVTDARTKLTLDYYIPANPAGQLLFKLIKKGKMENSMSKSLQRLESLVKEIQLSGTQFQDY
jgi:hypothetical protein